MARKKEFDPQKALDKAMQLFWLKGYDATSIDDLCTAMEIKRGSLYDTFGDKHSLFMKSLDRYTQINRPPPNLAAELGSGLQAIAVIFRSAVEDAVNDPQCRGCFMVNTISELAATDREVAEYSESQRQHYEKLFYDLLVIAEQDAEIVPNQDNHAKAQFLMNAYYGLRVTSKVNPDRRMLENIVETTLSVLR